MRSSKALGEWSFKRPVHGHSIRRILQKLSARYGVRVYSMANVGNHLHLQIKLGNCRTYWAFIYAITAAIAMAVTGASRWAPLKKSAGDRFWDYRPFTRVVRSLRAYLTLRDYIRINQLEGYGYRREQARWMIMRAARPARRARDPAGYS